MNEKTLLDMLTSIMQPAEAASTKVEHGHTAIDKEIDKFGGYTMSQAPERKLVGQGLGMLDWAATGLVPGAKDVKTMSAMMKVLKDISLKRSANKSMQQLKMGTDPSNVKELKHEGGVLQLYQEWLKLMGKSKNYSRAKNLYDTEISILNKLK